MTAPIVIFAFNRPDMLSRMIASLKSNVSFDKHEIFVYIDGPRNEADMPNVNRVIDISRELTSNIFASNTNKGLGASIIRGVSGIINKYGRAIVLEDDLVLQPGFLQYMDKALDVYESDSRIFSICGYGLKIKRPKDYEGDVYLCNRSSSWGWATWADRWNSVDWDITDWQELKSSKKLQRAFNSGGSDMYGMLKDYMEGRNRSWAIRFCYSQHKQGRYSVHPFRSLVVNEGYGADATNCRQKYSRFKIIPDSETIELNIPDNLIAVSSIITESAKYHSLSKRIYSKIRRILNI